ncbi:NADPH-dependent FMN reductase [Cellulomonas sp. S1-8]|uniref:NADPH-dependent FMN reductase n=1 Tax=Cellulomonas sp. S1-8 TaxID=2904790 RepID=UPI002243D3C3|nr:NAD(P)H-dependent oxidoreductase [Cellulomonas sp. S1-8]UZN04152.1 NAD(P)H-dependent oxidoreductase [Cellulomonas sp. S1-8]
MTTAIVVGNPKRDSRTLDAATRLHRALLGADADLVLELPDLGPGLLGWGDPAVAGAVGAVRASSLVIVASPTFKATYSGLLKLFLDQIPGGEGLRSTVAVPLMLGAGAAHALAPDLLLKPVLVELGAVTPAPGLYLSDATYVDDGAIDRYVERWGRSLRDARRSLEGT